MAGSGPAGMLLQAADEAARAALASVPDLDGLLARHLAAARAAWPEVALDEARFLRHVAARCTAERAAAFERLPAADLYLACACLGGDPAAVRAFDRDLLADVAVAVTLLPGGAALVDEVKAILREQLFVGARPLLENYAGAGSLRGWLRSIAVRTALRLRRAERAAAPLEEVFFLELATGDDPELRHMKETYRRELQAALAEAVAALTVRQRNLLRQHFIDGLSVDELGRLYRVHRATAARWAAAARADLIDATRRSLRARLGVTDSQVQSIVRLVLSQMEISLDRFP